MTQPLSFIVLTAGSDSEQELRSALSAERRARVLLMTAQAEQAYAEIIRERPFAAIITLGEQPTEAWAMCRRIRAVSPETALICASRNASPDLILESLRAGACEFLRLPVQGEEFRTVLARTAELSASETKTTKKRGRVITVFSTKGGCGTSFVAANLAVALSAPTVLVDLNLQAGDQDVFFGVKPRFSLADLVANRARVDDGLLASYLTPHSTQMSLLPAPRNAEAAENIRPEHIVEISEMLRERREFIVFDLPHTFDALTLAALDQADDILLVFTLDLLAARSAQRALYIFDRLGYARDKVRLVINRARKQRDLEVQHVERYLNEQVTALIPDDPAAVLNSINQGKPLVGANPNAPLAVEMRRLAGLCGGAPPSLTPNAARKNLLDSLFRRQSGALPLEFPALVGKAPAGD